MFCRCPAQLHGLLFQRPRRSSGDAPWQRQPPPAPASHVAAHPKTCTLPIWVNPIPIVLSAPGLCVAYGRAARQPAASASAAEQNQRSPVAGSTCIAAALCVLNTGALHMYAFQVLGLCTGKHYRVGLSGRGGPLYIRALRLNCLVIGATCSTASNEMDHPVSEAKHLLSKTAWPKGLCHTHVALGALLSNPGKC